MDVLGPGGLLFLAKVYHAGQLLTVIRPVQLQLRKEVGYVPGLVLQADDLPRHQVRVDVLPDPLDVYDVLLFHAGHAASREAGCHVDQQGLLPQ